MKTWFDGDYEAIFNSPDFLSSDVFEDGPWGCLDFYKVLFHKFPNSKFVLFTRDSDKWFDSMKSHSKGKSIGNTFRHSRIYNREKEFDEKFGPRYDYNKEDVDNLLELNESHREHYKRVFETRNRDIINFFMAHNPDRLIHCQLEHSGKWQFLGKSLSLTVPKDYDVHENASRNQ